MPFIYPSGGSNARYEPTGERRNGRPLYCVTTRFSYWTILEDRPLEVVIAPGFVTDLASIPSLPFMPNPAGSLWDDAAIVHDYLLRAVAGGRYVITYAQADAIFYDALLDRGCTRFTAWVFWAAVRLNSITKQFQRNTSQEAPAP
jgi:hypothetical protein